jgi:hypothetical protein
VQFFVIDMVSGNFWEGQIAVLDCAVADPPPTPPIAAVTTSDPPFVPVVIVAS